MMGQRETKAFLELLVSLALRVKREKEDHQVMVMVLLAPLVIVVSQGYKEKKVFLVLRERQVHQVGTLKGLVERRVPRGMWVKKETGV